MDCTVVLHDKTKLLSISYTSFHGGKKSFSKQRNSVKCLDRL